MNSMEILRNRKGQQGLGGDSKGALLTPANPFYPLLTLKLLLVLMISGCATTEPKKSSALPPVSHVAAPKENLQHIASDLTKMPDASTGEILATDISFDPKTGEVKYTLPEAALVRLRVGIKEGGPMLRTLLDWEPRDQGPHLEVWDKEDASGQIEIGARGDLLLVLTCRPAARQAGIPPDFKKGVSDILSLEKSPDFDVDFPLAAKEANQPLPILTGAAPIRITLSEKDKRRLTESKYEIMFFIDYVFLFEDEDGVSPFTYMFNTAGINEGEHVLTVNLIGYNGEVGTKSVKVFIKK